MKTACFVSLPIVFLLGCGGRSSLDLGEITNPGPGTISTDSGSGNTGGGPGASSSSGFGGSGSSSSSTSGGTSGPEMTGIADGGRIDSGGSPSGTGLDSGSETADAAGGTPREPPIVCGNTTCGATEECCVQVGGMGVTSACIARGGTCAAGITLSCTNRADCATGEVCCLVLGDRAATCQTTCGLGGGAAGGGGGGGAPGGAGFELCGAAPTAAACPAGEMCVAAPVAALGVCIPALGGLPGAGGGLGGLGPGAGGGGG